MRTLLLVSAVMFLSACAAVPTLLMIGLEQEELISKSLGLDYGEPVEHLIEFSVDYFLELDKKVDK